LYLEYFCFESNQKDLVLLLIATFFFKTILRRTFVWRRDIKNSSNPFLLFFKGCPGAGWGANPRSFDVALFSHSITLPLNHSGSPFISIFNVKMPGSSLICEPNTHNVSEFK
jgi:hypothetical protein